MSIGPTGWIPNPSEVSRTLATMPRPMFASAASEIIGTGEGKTSLVYKAWKDVLGRYIPYPAQTIGDCVSQAYAHGVDLLACVEIAVAKEAEEFKETATEAVYGMARVDVGGQRGSYSDGAVGAWAAKAVTTLGTTNREVVGAYDGRRAKEWGAKGVPAEVKEKALPHKVRTASLVTSAAEADDALANGYPIIVCSDQGFTMTRDANGFCRPQGTWMHAMLIAGVRADDKPGFLIVQSWGENVPSGPTTLDQPNYSFWAERRVVDRMLGQRDSFAISGFDGYPSQRLPDRWNYDGLA